MLLDFEVRFNDVAGQPASGFPYGIGTHRSAFVDGHSASLLALTQAARYLPDQRIPAAIDRGLASYCIETTAVDIGRPVKIDVVSTSIGDAHGNRHTENAYWNFNVGLALRLFGALRATPDPILQQIAAEHRERIELLEMLLRWQLRRSITEHANCDRNSYLGLFGRDELRDAALGDAGAARSSLRLIRAAIYGPSPAGVRAASSAPYRRPRTAVPPGHTTRTAIGAPAPDRRKTEPADGGSPVPRRYRAAIHVRRISRSTSSDWPRSDGRARAIRPRRTATRARNCCRRPSATRPSIVRRQRRTPRRAPTSANSDRCVRYSRSATPAARYSR